MAFDDAACATAASYCCCDTSSLASSPFRRSALRSSRTAVGLFADQPRLRRGETRFGGVEVVLGLVGRRPRDCSTPLCAERTPLLDVVAVIGTFAFAAAASASAVGQLRPGAVERNLVVARIDLDQHGALLHLLVVGDGHAQHRAADPGGHRRHVRVHLRVVGRLLAAGRSTTTRQRRAATRTTMAITIRTREVIAIGAPEILAMACSSEPGALSTRALAMLKS